MARKLIVTRVVSPTECPWFDNKTFYPGDEIFEFGGATYGCVNWDKGIAASLYPDLYPFFEFPVDAFVVA